MIERKRGAYIGRNKSSAYKDLVWTVATAKDVTLQFEKQAVQTFETVEENLKALI